MAVYTSVVGGQCTVYSTALWLRCLAGNAGLYMGWIGIIVQYCLYCTVLYCTALHCTGWVCSTVYSCVQFVCVHSCIVRGVQCTYCTAVAECTLQCTLTVHTRSALQGSYWLHSLGVESARFSSGTHTLLGQGRETWEGNPGGKPRRETHTFPWNWLNLDPLFVCLT